MSKTFKPGHFFLVNDQALRVKQIIENDVILIDDLSGCTTMVPVDTLALPVGATTPGKPVTPSMATFLVRLALAEVGLPRTSDLNGVDNLGLVADRIVRHGFTVRPATEQPEQIIWTITVSGKPHLDYIEQGDDGCIPAYPEKIIPQIRQAFAKLDLGVLQCQCVGWQREWDDDVHYEVTTEIPAWLQLKIGR